MHPFRAAVESGDHAAARALLHADVRFLSPAVFAPIEGRIATDVYLQAAERTFEDLTYVEELTSERSTILRFEARVGDRQIEGIDHITTDADGRITEFRVMVRPLSGLHAVIEAMQGHLADLGVPGMSR